MNGIRLLLAPIAAPLVPVYAAACAVRRWCAGEPARCDGTAVICVGNHTLGGSGKTEVVRALAAALRDRLPVAIVSRGYGRTRRDRNPVVVEPPAATVDPRRYGDEPVMLCRAAGVPVVVDTDRTRAIAVAARRGARVIIADDGYQNPSFHKDRSVLVLSAPVLCAPQVLFPLGDLRETLRSALARADLVVLNHVDRVGWVQRDAVRARIARLRPGVPVVETSYRLRGLRRLSDGAAGTVADVAGSRGALLVTGVGSPALVERAVREWGIPAARHLVYRDHRWFSPADVVGWRATELPVVTTAKDAVRIAAAVPAGHPVLDTIWVMEIELDVREGADAWRELIGCQWFSWTETTPSS
jgi:tetraacyldisaccharide 4'-kinase